MANQTPRTQRKLLPLFLRRMDSNGHRDSILPTWCAMMPAWIGVLWNGSVTTS